MPKSTVGNMIGSSFLNTYLRDNIDVLSTHNHTGGAGLGSATLDDVDSIDFDDQTLSDPSSGQTRFGSTSGALTYFVGGASVKTVSNTSHVHPH
jgi:hypothetical protein